MNILNKYIIVYHLTVNTLLEVENIYNWKPKKYEFREG